MPVEREQKPAWYKQTDIARSEKQDGESSEEVFQSEERTLAQDSCGTLVEYRVVGVEMEAGRGRRLRNGKFYTTRRRGKSLCETMKRTIWRGEL